MEVILDRLASLVKKISLAQEVDEAAAIDSYRLFHGRGRCFPGLEFITIDYFHPVLLTTLFAEPPAGWLEELIVQAKPMFNQKTTCLLVQRRYMPQAPSEILWGELPAEVYAQRCGSRFHLHLARQQNTGFFLDMEPGRLWLEQQAANRRVLNLFAYTCAFSVVAIAAGADKVVNVDMSRPALNIGRANHQLNGLAKSRSEFVAENILKSWSRVKKPGPYDLVIIDPPSYQKGSFVAEKDYARVIRRLPELMPDGGLALACLNAPELSEDFLKQQFAEQCPQAEFVERLQPLADFPDVDPQQQLKLLVYRIPAT